MFYGADTSALLEINRYLTINVATVGEFLSRAGELGRELYFVLSGEIHVLTASGQLDLQLFEGSVVGEVCLLFDMPSPHDAQVVLGDDGDRGQWHLRPQVPVSAQASLDAVEVGVAALLESFHPLGGDARFVHLGILQQIVVSRGL